MDSDRWKKLSQVFADSLDREPGDRDAYLQEACGDDVELRIEVERMLAADVDSVGRIADDALTTTLGTDSWEGRIIGPYRVVREHARGGMGRVFVAERADGSFDHVVALKILQSALVSDALLDRFRQERQILARLQHANIATLLDGGVTEDGQPWFAMEFVEGVAIDEYCDTHRLTVEERLRLFRDVCRALVYAHGSLVVHRDLKPDNILTTPEGRVRLLDFGIAKLIADEGDAPQKEGTALLALTPAYASPEQVRGEPVGTATDVYSLGVILYELLTGDRPYELSSRVPTEVERVVCGFDPLRPSTRITSPRTDAEKTATDIAGHDASWYRRTDRKKLRRRLSGDLDVICLKALRKEPDRRYATVQELLDDIDRHLEGQPVRARPATMGYRFSKSVRRNRWAWGAAAAVILTSTSLIAFYTSRVTAERDRARIEAEKAGEVANFLQGLFEVVDPEESLGRTITARELLDAGAERIDQGLAAQPEVQATMLRVIGEVYASLGLREEAVDLLGRAVELNRDVLGPNNEEYATSLLSLATSLQDTGDMAGAESSFLEAIQILEAALEPNDPATGEALRHYAYWLETDGRYDDAITQYESALEHMRAGVDREDPGLVSLLGAYGNLLRQLDDERAEPILREVLELRRNNLGSRHPDVASAARTLASLLRDERQFEESEALYLEALDIRREVYGPDHAEVAGVLNSYATMLSRKGDGQAALAIYRDFVRTMEAVHGGPHPDLAAGYHNLATTLREEGLPAEAEAYFNRSLGMQDDVLRESHPNRAFSRVGLASLFRDSGRYDEAEVLLREALEIRRLGLPEGHRHIGEVLSNLGAVLMNQDRFSEAEPYLVEAYDLLMEAEGPDAGRTRSARSRLVRLYESTGRPALADALTPNGGPLPN